MKYSISKPKNRSWWFEIFCNSLQVCSMSKTHLHRQNFNQTLLTLARLCFHILKHHILTKGIPRNKKHPQNIFHCILGYAKRYLNKGSWLFTALTDIFGLIYKKDEAISVYIFGYICFKYLHHENCWALWECLWLPHKVSPQMNASSFSLSETTCWLPQRWTGSK